jgi:hypothetical protein
MFNNVSALITVFFVLALIFLGIYFSKTKESKKKKWHILLYFLTTGILIGLLSVLGFFEFIDLPLWIFIVAQLWILLLGILHVYFLEKVIPLENKDAGKIFFALAIVFFGYGLTAFVFQIYFHDPFPRIYLIPALLFIAPTFVMIAFNYFIEIPEAVYKAWDFPAPGTLPDPTDQEMADPIIVNFEIRKHCEDAHRTIFKAKAPKFMKFGKLFYFFISDYNVKNSNNPILMSDCNEQPYKWIFYRPSNILIGKIHIDPEMTVSENRIKENSSVICERINIQAPEK